MNKNLGEKMLKVQKDKNRDGVEFEYIDLGDTIKVTPEIYEMNDTHFNSGSFYGQCSLCAKAIKNQYTSFTIICYMNDQTAIKLNQEEIAKNSGGFMNSFELGSECGKRVKKALKEAGLNWKDYIIINKKEGRA